MQDPQSSMRRFMDKQPRLLGVVQNSRPDSYLASCRHRMCEWRPHSEEPLSHVNRLVAAVNNRVSVVFGIGVVVHHRVAHDAIGRPSEALEKALDHLEILTGRSEVPWAAALEVRFEQ